MCVAVSKQVCEINDAGGAAVLGASLGGRVWAVEAARPVPA